MFILDIGLGAWEEVNILRGGANFGYAEREGIEQLFIGGPLSGRTGGQMDPPASFPEVDELIVEGISLPVTPVYPVAAYSHRDGDAISSGFVYRGSRVPALRGKFVFGDITTARLFACDVSAMLAADDGSRLTLAPVEELQVVYRGEFRRMFDIVADAYRERGGTYAGGRLPGGCGGLMTGESDGDGVPYGCGRADIRLAEDRDGELYVLSKSDGMIRRIAGSAIPPQIAMVPTSEGNLKLEWPGLLGRRYRIQFKQGIESQEWFEDWPDATAEEFHFERSISSEQPSRFFRVQLLPDHD
jgi:hypothetical protein